MCLGLFRRLRTIGATAASGNIRLPHERIRAVAGRVTTGGWGCKRVTYVSGLLY